MDEKKTGKIDPVAKGIAFEKLITDILNKSGFNAYRTNITNPYDPGEYKHGFDGGVDIIATWESDKTAKTHREFEFFIQCKCHKNDLTKAAIAEVYAGMHARKANENYQLPVVIAVGDASKETLQYAKSLGVELILREEVNVLMQARAGVKIPYKSYGIMTKLILFHHTKDSIWVDTLPIGKKKYDVQNTTDYLLNQANIDFDNAESSLRMAELYDRKANAERRKALDIQKAAVYRSIQASGFLKEQQRNKKKTHRESESPSDAMDGG